MDSNEPSNLEQRVDLAISGSPYLNGRKLRFETEDKKVVLKGKVGTYFQKQMAQEALRTLDGVELIDNQLEVTW
ncbi:MAG: BON domain-containing protein [Pirellulaceae bacterium]|nr:BON domain-containing protein [Planctomycetota bacterium]